MGKKEVVGSMSEWSGVLKDFFRQINDGSKTLRQVQLFLENKNPFNEQIAGVSSNTLSDLFDRQLEILHDRGCPNLFLAALFSQKSQVLAKASGMTFREGHIPFLPVIPFSSLKSSTQMAMVRNGSQTGVSCLDVSDIKDIVKIPADLYYIFDVEDGTDTLGQSVVSAERSIKFRGRSPLTAAEVISLGIQTDVLSKHYVDASGSRYGSGVRAPLLFLHDGEPGLNSFYDDDSNGKWGSASCGSRS